MKRRDYHKPVNGVPIVIIKKNFGSETMERVEKRERNCDLSNQILFQIPVYFG
jgi:hypothetical protein